MADTEAGPRKSLKTGPQPPSQGYTTKIEISDSIHLTRGHSWWHYPRLAIRWLGIILPKFIIAAFGLAAYSLIMRVSGEQWATIDYGFTVPRPMFWLLACHCTFAFPIALQFLIGVIVAVVSRGKSDLALLKPRGTAHDLAYHLLGLVCICTAAGHVLAVVYVDTKVEDEAWAACRALPWYKEPWCIAKLQWQNKVRWFRLLWPAYKQFNFRLAAYLSFPQAVGHLVHAAWNAYLLRDHALAAVTSVPRLPSRIQSAMSKEDSFRNFAWTLTSWFGFIFPKLLITSAAIFSISYMSDATEHKGQTGVDYGFIVLKSVIVLISVIFTFSIPTGGQLVFGLLAGREEEIRPTAANRVAAGHEALFHLAAVAGYIACFVLVWEDVWDTSNLLRVKPFSRRKRVQYVISATGGLVACIGHMIDFGICLHFTLPTFYEKVGLWRATQWVKSKLNFRQVKNE